MIKVREGKKEDLPKALELIRELAIYEKAEHEVENTVERMEVDGFGENPVYGFILAEMDGEVIGMSMYYYRYSTWKGKRLYLEDLIVTESARGSGAGKLLLDETVAIAKRTQCTGVMWQVLDWNEPAIKFYEKYGAELDSGWINCNLHF